MTDSKPQAGTLAVVAGLGLVGSQLAGVIFVAIGISGGLAAILGASLGHDYVIDVLLESTVTPERCVELMRLVPEAADCAAALSEHEYQELISFRFLAGVFGVLAIAAHFILNRKWTWAQNHQFRATGIGYAMGLAAFAAATALMALIAFANGNLSGNNGPGEWLSAAGVSASFSIAYFILLVRRLKNTDAA